MLIDTLPTLHALHLFGHKSLMVSIEQSAALHQDRLSQHFISELAPVSFGIVLLFGASSPFSGPPITKFLTEQNFQYYKYEQLSSFFIFVVIVSYTYFWLVRMSVQAILPEEQYWAKPALYMKSRTAALIFDHCRILYLKKNKNINMKQPVISAFISGLLKKLCHFTCLPFSRHFLGSKPAAK